MKIKPLALILSLAVSTTLFGGTAHAATQVAYKIKIASDYYKDRYVDGMVLHMGVNGWKNIKDFEMQKKVIYQNGIPSQQWFEVTVIVNQNDIIDYDYAARFSGILTWNNNSGKDYHINAGKGNTSMISKIPVNFTVKNAYTVPGERVYFCGNTQELGNWNTSMAAGEAVCPDYPTWNYTVSLIPGQIIQYKTIIKGYRDNCKWEGGSNHAYTVPFSGIGTCNTTWQN